MDSKIKAVSSNQELIRKRREQIINSAEKIFNKKGFHKTTIREIGKVAKLSTGTIYDYLGNKEDILFLIYEKNLEKMNFIFNSVLKEKETLDKKLQKILTQVLIFADEYQDLILTIFQESRNFKKSHLKKMLTEEVKFITVFEELMKKSNEKGMIKVSNPKLAGNIISYLTLLGVLRRWKLRNEFKRDELIKGILEFVFYGINYREKL